MLRRDEQRPEVKERRRLYKQAWYQRRKQAGLDETEGSRSDVVC